MTEPATQQSIGNRALARNILRLVLDVYHARPLPAIGMAIVTLLAGLRLTGYMLAIGGLSQSLIDGDRDRALFWAGVWVITYLFEDISWLVEWYLTSIVLDHSIFAVQERVLSVSAAAPLVAFERGEFFALMQRATDNVGSRLSGMITGIRNVILTSVGAAGILGPLWFIDPLLIPIFVLAAVPGFYLQIRVATLIHQVRKRHARTDVVLDKLGTILTSRTSAAEIRLFGNGPSLVQRWSRGRRRRGDDAIEALGTQFRSGVMSEIWQSAACIAALALVVWLMLRRETPIGSWAIIVAGMDWALSMAWGTAMTGRDVREQSAYISDIFAFEDEADRIVADSQRSRRNVESSDRATETADTPGMVIEATDLSFSYAEDGRKVIDGISLSIADGEHVAIVGENGAGKSTLVRLLTGLYLPDDGSVVQDGVDTASESALTKRDEIGAVFQDFATWQLTVRENIGFGDVDHVDDDNRLHRAASEAGIADLIGDLPGNWNTYLGRTFGDLDLSGGEWQRIALARAFFRHSRFLVLDEPTSALDPLAEQRVFEQFNALAKDRTSLTVSHRLGPARYSDRIIVLDRGKIIEQGTHDELIQSRGRYYEMFEAQAEWYR